MTAQLHYDLEVRRAIREIEQVRLAALALIERQEQATQERRLRIETSLNDIEASVADDWRRRGGGEVSFS